MSFDLQRIVGRLSGGGAQPARLPVDPVAARRQAEQVVRERVTREAVQFQEALADCVIKRLGIASVLTADDVHVHLGRIMSGSAALTLLDEIILELGRRRVGAPGGRLEHDHLAACLCSPMMSVLVKRRLAPLLEVVEPGVDPEDAEGEPG